MTCKLGGEEFRLWLHAVAHTCYATDCWLLLLFVCGGREGGKPGSIVSRLARTRKQSLHVTGFVPMMFVAVVSLIV